MDDDFAAVAALYLTVWRTTYRGQLPAAYLASLTPQTWHPQQRWRQTVLAFNAQQQIVGVCSYGPARRQAWAGYQEIYSIYILPAYQHQGLGRRLMAAALAQLPTPAPVMIVALASNVAAIQFYQHYGFEKIAQPLVETLPVGVKLTEQVLVLNK